jgi:hypothetical protein
MPRKFGQMTFAYPSQRLQDWLSQQWCILTGHRFDPIADPWLTGPYGHVDVIEDSYVDALASNEGLVVQKNHAGTGLYDTIDALNVPKTTLDRVKPQVIDFYEHTLNYEFEVWSQWCQFYRPFAGLLARLYSRRLQQLNLPLDPLDTALGIRSQIYKLVDPRTGSTKYTIWYRHLKANGHVIYSGIYSHCKIPDGSTCLKVTFPLPRGNATVVMKIETDDDGGLTLISKGKKLGDPGFYFLLTDSKDRHWVRYIPSFHESIRVYVDREHVLRADHIVNVWASRALHLHYRINPIRPAGPALK